MECQLGGWRWQPGLGLNGEERWAPISDGGEASESAGSGALPSPSGTPGLSSHHFSLTLLGSSFCLGIGGSSGQWKELWPCTVALALALSCCVILGKSELEVSTADMTSGLQLWLLGLYVSGTPGLTQTSCPFLPARSTLPLKQEEYEVSVSCQAGGRRGAGVSRRGGDGFRC